nr:SGNH/GDSL hydrolase family protein [Oscillochloris trichoides]
MRRVIILMGLAMLILIGCGGQPLTPQEVASMDLQRVAAKRIFFGHQSVGWNIITGIDAILQAHPDVTMTFTTPTEYTDGQGAAFVHTEVGQNYDPLSKLQDFDRLIREGLGDRVEIAFFKFCYVDFDQQTDVEQLFTTYQATMDALQRDYPDLTLVYVTTPLMAPDQGAKGFLKGMLGRNQEVNANTKRHQFNELLRASYAASGTLFDLAATEATALDGTACTMKVDGASVPCLVRDYTDDGGHLNSQGQRVVAGSLIAFLATLN